MPNCIHCGFYASTPAEAHAHTQVCTGRKFDTYFKQGISSSMLSNDQYQKSGMSTFASVILYNSKFLNGKMLIQSAKNLSNSQEHAEDVLVRGIKSRANDLSTFGTNLLYFNLSKSPCSSSVANPTFDPTTKKTRGCTETLIDLQKNGLTINGEKYNFQIHIICYQLYQGGPGKLTGSIQAAHLLESNGISLNSDVHLNKGGIASKKAYSSSLNQ